MVLDFKKDNFVTVLPWQPGQELLKAITKNKIIYILRTQCN